MQFNDEVWDVVDAAVLRLDEALRRDVSTELSPFVPEPNSPHRLRVLIELVKVDQEYRWKAKQPQPLEEYLRDWPELACETETVAELLRTECQTRAFHGKSPERQELEARHEEVGGERTRKPPSGDASALEECGLPQSFRRRSVF